MITKALRLRQVADEIIAELSNPTSDKKLANLYAEKERLERKIEANRLKNKTKREAKADENRMRAAAKVAKRTKKAPKNNPEPKSRNPLASKRKRERREVRRERQFSIADGYRDFIVHQPFCAYCGKPRPNGCDPAHLDDRSIGGGPESMLNLCRECHQFEETHGRTFAILFEERHGIHPLVMAKAMREAYLLELAEKE